MLKLCCFNFLILYLSVSEHIYLVDESHQAITKFKFIRLCICFLILYETRICLTSRKIIKSYRKP